jgi:hypothetical protein
MEQFRVDKDRVAASLTLATGHTVTGCFFVLGSLNNAVGHERIGDLLNAEDGFFPFQRDDGTTAQYNRAHVVFVRLPVGVDEEALEPGYDVAQRRSVIMTLSTGARIDGTITVYGPAGHFRYVVTPFGSVIVNADHIVEVVEKPAS